MVCVELIYDFVLEVGFSDLDVFFYGYLLGLGGSFSDISSIFVVVINII